MAKDDELDLATTKGSSGGKGKLIIIIVAVVLLTAGAVIGTLFFTGALGSGGSKDESSDAKEEPKELEVKPAFYMNLQPAFVVNFEDQTHAAYLQVEMQVMARDKELLDMVVKHMPVIRNNILLILSAQKYEQVKTRKGKEELQAIILEAVQKIISEATQGSGAEEDKDGEQGQQPKNIEQVYFTSFIMQ